MLKKRMRAGAGVVSYAGQIQLGHNSFWTLMSSLLPQPQQREHVGAIGQKGN